MARDAGDAAARGARRSRAPYDQTNEAIGAPRRRASLGVEHGEHEAMASTMCGRAWRPAQVQDLVLGHVVVGAPQPE